MDMSSMCCPSPSQSVIPPVGDAAKARKALYAAMWGEVACSVAKLMLFGTFSGLLNLISVWICYMAYATMHFC